LSEVLTRYATYKDADKDRLLMNRIERSRRYLRECLGATAVDSHSVEEIKRKDANRFRDFLIQQGLKPTSIKRTIGQVRTALNFCIKEEDLDVKNPFSGIIIKNSESTADDRLPLAEQDISLLDEVYNAPNDINALYLTLRDTGARLSEICYLEVGDVSLQDKSVAIRPNSLRGSLKTLSSNRTIPLSDKALTALQALRVNKSDEEAIFTRYARPRGADTASQTLMKRLRKHIKDPKKSIHSLRHRTVHLLRNAGVQEEVKNAILGHSSTNKVSANYGSGYDIEVLREALSKTW
jgi:integrase